MLRQLFWVPPFESPCGPLQHCTVLKQLPPTSEPLHCLPAIGTILLPFLAGELLLILSHAAARGSPAGPALVPFVPVGPNSWKPLSPWERAGHRWLQMESLSLAPPGVDCLSPTSSTGSGHQPS